MTTTVRDLVDRSISAHRSLADLGEELEDEWSYVNDLHAAWSDRLTALDDAGAVADETVRAIDTAIAELGLVTDPHRAIDWLSTFPQVVLLALGGPD